MKIMFSVTKPCKNVLYDSGERCFQRSRYRYYITDDTNNGHMTWEGLDIEIVGVTKPP
jgi:hypothetical protein